MGEAHKSILQSILTIGIQRAMRRACWWQLEQRPELFSGLLQLQQPALELEHQLLGAPFLQRKTEFCALDSTPLGENSRNGRGQ